MYEYLLPIGTVVRLKDAKRLLMIIGLVQTVVGKGVYDYTAVTYPEGFLDSRLKILFNQEDIEEVVFKGFEGNAQEHKALVRLIQMAREKEKAEEGTE